MNRIILIGNGFDLAHGMKTSYNDFMDDFWEKEIKEMKKHKGVENYFNKNDLFYLNKIPYSIEGYRENFYYLNENLKKVGCYIHYNNLFLKTLMDTYKTRSWVDIENEYYLLLKKIIEEERSTFKEKSLNVELSNCCKTIQDFLNIFTLATDIEEKNQSNKAKNNTHSKTQKELNMPKGKITLFSLNQDFKVIQNLLEEYLIRQQKIKLIKNDKIHNAIYSPLQYNDFTEQRKNEILDFIIKRWELYKNKDKNKESYSKEEISIFKALSCEMSDIKIRDTIEEKIIKDVSGNLPNLKVEKTLLLNFNYTSYSYLNAYLNHSEGNNKKGKPLKYKKTELIHIHGKLNDEDNPIIFGYGDELDDDYHEIEKLNDNEFMENIKSVKYLETDNYKKLLSFINSEPYQVFIFGHSCGNSDRTLLNTLFEHENCCSIKPFYRKKSDGTDNYSDIVRNISRCFKDKASLRDKVVNKKYTQALFT